MIKPTRLAWAWALMVCLLLGHNAYLWFGQRIAPDTDILALLPVQERDPVLQQSFTHMVDAAQQRVIVLVGAPTWEGALAAASAYEKRLASRPGLLAATKVDGATEADWLAPFEAHRLALLTAQQEAQLREDTPQEWVERALLKLNTAFSGPKLGAFKDDPFGLFPDWVQERAGETPVRPRDGRLFVADQGGTSPRQYVVMPLTMTASAFSIGAQQAVAPLLAAAADDARAATPGVRVIAAGVVLHAAAAAAQAEREMSTIGLGSLAGIVVLTWLTFHSLRPILLVLTSVGIGFLGAMSVCWLLFGRIHLLTLVFGASLIGVAQDYGLYYLCNRLGAERTVDSQTLLRRLLPGLCLTLLAAVIGYAGLGFTPFPGLRHMAVFSACGLIFAWATVVLWFPALVGPDSLRAGSLTRHYTALLARWPRVRGPGAVVALLAFAAFSAYGWSQLTVNDDIRSLQTPPKQLLDDQIALGKLLEVATPVQYFLVRGANAQALLEREEALKARLDPLIADGTLGGYQAMSNWVPSTARQAARRQLIADKLLREDGPLVQLADQLGEDAAWVQATREHLLAEPTPLTPEAFLRTPASEPWRHLWLGAVEGQGHASIVALRGFAFKDVARLRMAGEGLAGVQWADKVAEISTVLGRYRGVMSWTVAAAYLVVLLLLLPRYKARAWRVLVPTLLASVATVALLGLTGQSIQLFHVLALLLLLGIGVDYGVFMHEQALGQATGNERSAWLAVGLSAVSTILSFGLLALSHTPALRNFGLTMLIGTTLAWLLVTSFTEQRKELAHAQFERDIV